MPEGLPSVNLPQLATRRRRGRGKRGGHRRPKAHTEPNLLLKQELQPDGEEDLRRVVSEYSEVKGHFAVGTVYIIVDMCTLINHYCIFELLLPSALGICLVH